MNTYTGGTTIDNGNSLFVGLGGKLAGDININSGGTLMGPGTVGNVTVNAGGTIFPNSPGSGILVSNNNQSTSNQLPGAAETNVVAIPSGGALQINGNFTQGSGSKYSVELTPAGFSDSLNISGTAQINSGTVLNLALDSGTFAVGAKYSILTAGGGLNGTYGFVSTSPTTQNIAFTEQYGPKDLQVTVNSNLAPECT